MIKASVYKNGAVLLGKNVVCDAHAPRPLRVVTHGHWDHYLGFEESLEECRHILMTPFTREMMGILKGTNWISSPKCLSLEYGVPFGLENETITLYPSGHIVGAAQVLVKTQEGEKLLYTGDFKFPQAKIIPSDILVMEATYGNPAHVRNFKTRIEDELISLTRNCLKEGPVYVLGYYGKLQEALFIYSKVDLGVPFILQGKVGRMTKLCQKYGLKLGTYLSASHPEAQKLIQGKERFVGLYHMMAERGLDKDVARISLSGWEFEKTVRKLNSNMYLVALSDHADFEELLAYVRETRPKLVITDNYRVGDAPALAREISARIGIPAEPMP
ncbi:MAG: hypothetical protein ACE5K3_04585 [bacterium]